MSKATTENDANFEGGGQATVTTKNKSSKPLKRRFIEFASRSAKRMKLNDSSATDACLFVGSTAASYALDRIAPRPICGLVVYMGATAACRWIRTSQQDHSHDDKTTGIPNQDQMTDKEEGATFHEPTTGSTRSSTSLSSPVSANSLSEFDSAETPTNQRLSSKKRREARRARSESFERYLETNKDILKDRPLEHECVDSLHQWLSNPSHDDEQLFQRLQSIVSKFSGTSKKSSKANCEERKCQQSLVPSKKPSLLSIQSPATPSKQTPTSLKASKGTPSNASLQARVKELQEENRHLRESQSSEIMEILREACLEADGKNQGLVNRFNMTEVALKNSIARENQLTIERDDAIKELAEVRKLTMQAEGAKILSTILCPMFLRRFRFQLQVPRGAEEPETLFELKKLASYVKRKPGFWNPGFHSPLNTSHLRSNHPAKKLSGLQARTLPMIEKIDAAVKQTVDLRNCQNHLVKEEDVPALVQVMKEELLEELGIKGSDVPAYVEFQESLLGPAFDELEIQLIAFARGQI